MSPITWIELCEAHGRVRAGSRIEALDSAHQAWAEARAEGRSVVLMAADPRHRHGYDVFTLTLAKVAVPSSPPL